VKRLVERSFEVRAPANTVWTHLANVVAWPSWARHIRKITLDPPGELTPATRGRLIIKPMITTTFVMTALDAPRSWSWRGKFAGTTLDYDHRIDEVDDRTSKVTFTIEGSGATARVVGPAFAFAYGRILDRAIRNLIAQLDALGS
jgi:hypothetical protein